LIGGTYNNIQDAFFRGHRHKFHFIDYTELTKAPKIVMNRVYDFLGKPKYEHDFNNVMQYTIENDAEHGFTDLHTIRSVVKPQSDDSREVLGPIYNRFAEINYKF
jgi:sulfotransferase